MESVATPGPPRRATLPCWSAPSIQNVSVSAAVAPAGRAPRKRRPLAVTGGMEVAAAVAALLSGKAANQKAVYASLGLAVDRFTALDDDAQVEFRDALKSYVRAYAFLAQVMPWTERALEELYLYGRALATLLQGQRTIRCHRSPTPCSSPICGPRRSPGRRTCHSWRARMSRASRSPEEAQASSTTRPSSDCRS